MLKYDKFNVSFIEFLRKYYLSMAENPINNYKYYFAYLQHFGFVKYK